MPVDPNAGATPINGQDGHGEVTVNSVTYGFEVAAFQFRAMVEMLTADTLSNEGEADQEPGREQGQFSLVGILKKGTPNAGPLIPPPQNVPVVLQYSENCTISFNANFTEATADRTTNQLGTLSARGLTKKGYVVAWDDGT